MEKPGRLRILNHTDWHNSGLTGILFSSNLIVAGEACPSWT